MRTVLCLVIIFCSLFSTAFASLELHINIPEYLLTVIDKGQIIKKYNIAVGTPYEQTPTGTFKIFDKIENPTWYPGPKFADQNPVPTGPDNPLGTRWMEFHPSYGIHGTNKDWDISYPVSGGCIRMHDTDARELYEMAPIGTPVTITYQTMFLVEKADGLYLRALPDIYNKGTNSQEYFTALYKPYAAEYKLIKIPSFPITVEDEQVYEAKIAEKPNSVKPQVMPKPGSANTPNQVSEKRTKKSRKQKK